MELYRDKVFWGSFTDELEKIARGKPPNPAQLMKQVKPTARPMSPVPTPATRPVVAPPPGSTITLGPQQAFVAQPNKMPMPQQASVPTQPLLGGQSNVPPFGAMPVRGASGNMMTNRI